MWLFENLLSLLGPWPLKNHCQLYLRYNWQLHNWELYLSIGYDSQVSSSYSGDYVAVFKMYSHMYIKKQQQHKVWTQGTWLIFYSENYKAQNKKHLTNPEVCLMWSNSKKYQWENLKYPFTFGNHCKHTKNTHPHSLLSVSDTLNVMQCDSWEQELLHFIC